MTCQCSKPRHTMQPNKQMPILGLKIFAKSRESELRNSQDNELVATLMFGTASLAVSEGPSPR